MNKITKLIMLWVVALMALPVSAQQRRISGTVSDDIDVIIGANVVEKDKNNRIVSQAVTDFNGNFTMTIKNPNNNLVVSYIGYKTYVTKLAGKTVFKITLQDNTKTLKDVVVTGKKMAPTTGLEIPAREFAGAVQKFNMDDMEGLAFESVDQALQGQIAGLDIVANSGNLGAGTTMRLRGTSTLNADAQPLIVVDDHIFELPDDAQSVSFEDMDNEEQFSTLLNVNPEDIESITVLKDAATAAKWGARGSNGVIEIKLRRGRRGPTSVNFSYKFTGTWQPDGYNMLNGDEYTMMMKESYFNPYNTSTEIKELDYNMSYPAIYNNFNKNTDWVDAVKQFGAEHKWYVTLSGGGEKATFRISAGYDRSSGSIIAQTMDRFTTNTTLDYWVSDRIKFSSKINMTFTTNNKNYGNDILSRAYKAMPNMSIYEWEPSGQYDSNGNPIYYESGDYFNMFPLAAEMSSSSLTKKENTGTMTSYELRDMFTNGNPVARAQKAWNKEKQYNLSPQFSIEYKLLGKDDDHYRLNYVGDVQLNIYNTSSDQYCPAELTTMPWVYGGDNSASGIGNNNRNVVSNSEYKSLEFTTRHDLRFYSAFPNKDHSLMVLGRFEMATGNSSNQYLGLWNVPTGITDPTVTALPSGTSASNNSWRSQSFFFQTHYSYKSAYSLDASVRIDGSTNFGEGNKYGVFPAVGGRWNITDEKWMQWSKKWLSMLAFRPTWGVAGNSSIGSYNQYNRYSSSGYYNSHSVIVPENLSLSSIKWERTSSWNLGFNLGLLDDLLTFELEVYNKKTTDLLMYNQRIPAANGFSNLSVVNGGTLRNKGWELNFSTGKFAKIGKFSMKVRANVSQNYNEIEEMNSLLLENLNGSETYQPTNLSYNQRVQIGNALGSIYGLHYQGVYAYDYDHNGYTADSWNSYGYNESVSDGNGGYRNAADYKEAMASGTGYHYEQDANGNWYQAYSINTASAASHRGDNSTCPVAKDANGNMLTDAKGNPLAMYYSYNNDGATRYQFRGGDVIYEDINHDGQIDRYDMVYLGNSNPKVYGGFGFQMYYGRFSLNVGFNFRAGFKIVNLARMENENMVNNNNQSFATTHRWRYNGQVTEIPRALNYYGTGYNSYNALPSDRYVEDGDFVRVQYIQLSYDFDPKKLKKIGMKSLKLFASINNPWCWSKYTGVDPEVSPSGYAVAKDTSKTPRSRSFTCSINVGF